MEQGVDGIIAVCAGAGGHAGPLSPFALVKEIRREFDGVVMGWVVEFKLDETDLFHSDRIDQPFAWSGTQNPAMDRLLDELSTTIDREEAKALWAEYQGEVVQEQPYTFFYFPDRLDGVSTRLKGVEMDARGEWLNIRQWYLDPASR